MPDVEHNNWTWQAFTYDPKSEESFLRASGALVNFLIEKGFIAQSPAADPINNRCQLTIKNPLDKTNA